MSLTISGTSLQFPFRLTGLSDVEKAEGSASIAASLYSLVNTAAANPLDRTGGQRIYNRAIGVNIYQYLFISDTDVGRAQIRNEFRTLNTYEPRALISDVLVSKNPLKPYQYFIHLQYIEVATQEPRNLVVPVLTPDRFEEIAS